jgi:hypothetical protein
MDIYLPYFLSSNYMLPNFPSEDDNRPTSQKISCLFKKSEFILPYSEELATDL